MAISLAVPAVPAAAASTSCRSLRVPVRVSAMPEHLHATLCTPTGARTVFVLFPGATYDSTYWDYPVHPQEYSQVRSLGPAGFASLRIDPFGNADSSRPASPRLNASTEADVLHQVITALRTGAFGSAYQRVILMGHSLGSTIVALTAARYPGIDGVVLTGLVHRFNPIETMHLFTEGFEPATADPKFAGRHLDPGYLTTTPGARARFFNAPDTEPAVLAAEERNRGVYASTDVPDAGALIELLPTTRLIQVPVLLALGGADRIMCGTPPMGTDCSTAASVRVAEAPYFDTAAHLAAFVLPHAGHSLTTAPNTVDYQRAVIAWARAFVEEAG